MSLVPPLPAVTGLLVPGGIAQMCWVVPSLEEAIAGWIAQSGVGPWLTLDNSGTIERRERGRPSGLTYRAAVAQAGTVQIELIEQTSPGGSCLRDVVAEGSSGLHHLATITDRYDLARAAAIAGGREIAFEARFGALRFCMVDARASLGFMLELLEDGPDLQGAFALVRGMASGWDGTTDPIRSLESVAAGRPAPR